jgi:hypothetical protein
MDIIRDGAKAALAEMMASTDWKNTFRRKQSISGGVSFWILCFNFHPLTFLFKGTFPFFRSLNDKGVVDLERKGGKRRCSMRRKWLITILSTITILTAVSSAFALDPNYKASCEERMRPESKYHRFYRFYRRRLGPRARRYWREFKFDFDKEGRQLYRRLLRKERELRELLREKPLDKAEIHRLIDELASIWAETQKKMVDSYLHLKEKLHIPSFHGYWWYWGEDCPFSPLE